MNKVNGMKSQVLKVCMIINRDSLCIRSVKGEEKKKDNSIHVIIAYPWEIV